MFGAIGGFLASAAVIVLVVVTYPISLLLSLFGIDLLGFFINLL